MMGLLRELLHQAVRTSHRSTQCVPMLSVTGRRAVQFETLKAGFIQSPITEAVPCHLPAYTVPSFSSSSCTGIRTEKCYGQTLLSKIYTESQTLHKNEDVTAHLFSQKFEKNKFLARWKLFNRYEMRTADRCPPIRFYVTNAKKTSRGDVEKLSSSSAESYGAVDKTETLHNTANEVSQRYDMIMTIPNVLTFMRMLLAPVLGYLVLTGSYATGCGVFIVASITDLLDGFIARHCANQTSALGSFIDPLADKLLVCTLFISLTVVNLIPVLLTSLVIARDICLMSAGFYVRYISLNPRPKSLKQYFDVTNASAHLKPTMISKLNTGIQLSLVALTLGSPVFCYVDHPALHALWYITAASTVISGISYVYAKNTFKIIQQTRKKS